MNNTDKDQKVTIDVKEAITLKKDTLFNVVGNDKYEVGADGKIEVTVPAYRGVSLDKK